MTPFNIGDRVKYDGFDKDCNHKIVTATVIGYDEQMIYTGIVSPKDMVTQHPSWDDTLYLDNVTRDFRIGFHRSRLISVVKFEKLIIDHKLIQKTLF